MFALGNDLFVEFWSKLIGQWTFLIFLLATSTAPCESFGGTLLEGDNGRSSCYVYHKGQHIYDFEESKQYCEEFGGALVTITGPKDQENVIRMISNGITANANSVICII